MESVNLNAITLNAHLIMVTVNDNALKAVPLIGYQMEFVILSVLAVIMTEEIVQLNAQQGVLLS
jgi:hypothetical protein